MLVIRWVVFVFCHDVFIICFIVLKTFRRVTNGLTLHPNEKQIILRYTYSIMIVEVLLFSITFV